MSLNDTLNELGMSVHNASQASQKLERELKEAGDRVEKLNDKNEQVKKLDAKIAELSGEVQELETKKIELEKAINSLREKFK